MRSKMFWFSEALCNAVGEGSLRQDGILDGCNILFTADVLLTDDDDSACSGDVEDFPVNQKVRIFPFP